MFDYARRRWPSMSAAAAGAHVYVRVLEGYNTSPACFPQLVHLHSSLESKSPGGLVYTEKSFLFCITAADLLSWGRNLHVVIPGNQRGMYFLFSSFSFHTCQKGASYFFFIFLFHCPVAKGTCRRVYGRSRSTVGRQGHGLGFVRLWNGLARRKG